MDIEYPTASDPLLRRPQVEKAIGLKRAMLYRLISTGTFPRPVQLTARAVAWRKSDINSWIAERRGKAV